MKIYDISLTIGPGLPIWPGDPPIEMKRVRKIEEGANCNVTELRMSVHSGTHLDAPFHFFPLGSSVETLPLDVLVGEAQVVHLPDACQLVSRDILEQAGILKGTQRLLIRTRNSHFWAEKRGEFQPDFVGLSPDGADYLVEQGVRLVGLDYLSVAPYKKSRPVHEILLKSGVIALEGVILWDVPAGIYQLCCLPLKLLGSDGAPVRAILISG